MANEEYDKIPESVKKQIKHIAEVCERRKPVVMISCITYNHEAYLRDALEGFVMQETDFPFVAVVHDDASTDGTASVLREYAERYPDIILPIYEEENQYSKSDGSLGRVVRTARAATGARYVAMCEGDDYWVDPLKLQKQVEALEQNPNATACYTSYRVVDSFGNSINDLFFDKCKALSHSGIQFNKLLKTNYIQTCTFVYKRDISNNEIYSKCPVHIDYALFLSFAFRGELIYIDDSTAAYRVQPNSVTRTNLRQLGDWCSETQLYFWELAIENRRDAISKPGIVRYLWVNEWRNKRINHFSTVKGLFRIRPFAVMAGGFMWGINMLRNKILLMLTSRSNHFAD